MNRNWIYSIDIKLSEEMTWKSIRELCQSVIDGLNNLIPKINNSEIIEKEYLADSLEEIKHSFEVRILDEEDFSMDETSSTDECNWLLDQLYDIADLRVILKGDVRKFIWINKQ